MRKVCLLEIVCLVLLSACATRSENLHCDRRLQPINPPAVGGLAAPAAHAGLSTAAAPPRGQP